MNRIFPCLLVGLLIQSLSLFSAYGSQLKQQSCRISDLDSRIEKTFQEFLEKARYDRVLYYLATKTKPFTPEAASEKFDSLDLLHKSGGANCVGMAAGLKEVLEPILPFETILSTLPPYLREEGFPERAHVALAAQCEDGIVLLDPAFNNWKPVLLSQQKPEATIDLGGRGRLQLWLKNPERQIDARIDVSHLPNPHPVLAASPQEYTYVLEAEENPDEKVSARFFQNDSRVLIYAYPRPGEPFRRLVAGVKTGVIDMIEVLPSGEVVKLFNFSFSKHYEDENALERDLPVELAEKLRISKSELVHELGVLMNRVRK